MTSLLMGYRPLFINYLMIFACLFTMNAFGLSLKAEVDRNKISMGETFRLTVIADEIINDNIDFSQLTHQFNLVDTRRSSSRSIVNGEITASTRWTLILEPKESGNLVIPSFTVKSVFSQAIPISVTKTGSNKKVDTRDLDAFLQASIDKKSIYVQEQVLLTLKLFYSINLTSYHTDPLEIDDSIIEKVSENNLQTKIRGKNFNILELVYAIHPQASGSLVIPKQRWRLEKAGRSFRSFGRSANPYLYTQSDAIKIEVKPIPNKSTANQWLPSPGVTLKADWHHSKVNATVGEPLRLKLTLNATNLTAAQLPTINLPQTDDFTVYTAAPETNTKRSAQGVSSSKISQFSIIPKEAGRFEFPEIQLKWWNIRTDKEETITLDSETVIVASSQLSDDNPLPANPLPQQNLAGESITPEPKSLWLWQTFSGILLGICFLLCIQLYRMQGNPAPVKNSKKEEYTTSEKKILQQIKTASKSQQWQSLRKLIIEWGKLKTGNIDLHSLNELGKAYPELQLTLQQFDNHLYGNTLDNSWKADRLIDLLNNCESTEALSKGEVLKPLYQ